MNQEHAFELNDICKEIVRTMRKEHERETGKDKRSLHKFIHSLLLHYNDMRLVVEQDKIPPTPEELEEYQFEYIQGLMEGREDKIENVLEDDRKRRIKNFLQFKAINDGVELYKKSLNYAKDENRKRQFRCLEQRYLGSVEMTVDEIAAIENISEATVNRDLWLAEERLAFFVRPDSVYFNAQ